MQNKVNYIRTAHVLSTFLVWMLLSALTIQISSDLILNDAVVCKFLELEESQDNSEKEKEKEKELEDFVVGDHDYEEDNSSMDLTGMGDFQLPLLEHYQNIVAPPPELS